MDIEILLINSAIQAPADCRLFFVAASWLGVHHHLVDMRRLGRKLEDLEAPASAVAGALLSVANEIVHAPRPEAVTRYCRPVDEPRPLFELRCPLACSVTREGVRACGVCLAGVELSARGSYIGE